MENPSNTGGGNGNGKHPKYEGRNELGQWVKGVTGNPNGPPSLSPLGRVFKAFVEEAGRDEHIPKYINALRAEINEHPAAFMRDLWNRTPKDVQVAVLATLMSKEERSGLVKKFEVAGGDERAVNLVHQALTRVAEETCGQPPSRG